MESEDPRIIREGSACKWEGPDLPPLPPYRHLPGLTPHPVRDPRGHSFRRREPSKSEAFVARRWYRSREYLRGVDLFNHHYFWEAHESWEDLWRECARDEVPGLFLSGLIQVSAALLKRALGRPEGMKSLASKGLAKLRLVARAGSRYGGIDLLEWSHRIETIIDSPDLEAWAADPQILLESPTDSQI